MFRFIVLTGLLVAGHCAAESRCSVQAERAANDGDSERLMELIENGENINCLGEWNQSLLIKAIQSGHPSAAKLLISKGVDSGIPDDEGDLALHRSAMLGQLEVFDLLANEITINTKGRLGMTPLMWAANRNHLGVVELAVSKGANLSDQCDNGYTALSYTSSPEVAELLLKAGANPYIESIRGLDTIGNAREHIERVSEFAPESEQISRYNKIIQIIEDWSAVN